jgi:PAS domain S-box-containing protein
MSENEELLRLASDLTPFDLPIGVYVVTNDGRFVSCNRRAREILRLSLEGDVEDSIVRFYSDPAYRDQMQEVLRAAEFGHYLEKVVLFEVNGSEVFVQDYTRALRGKDGNVLGYVCCMTDVTEGERSNRLLDALPVGIYMLDANDNCAKASRAFARILGYDSIEVIIGEPSSNFYVDREEAARLRKLVEEKHPEPVTNFIAELLKKDGETIFVNINEHMVEGEDGCYAGREGVIIDVTRQERYHRILRDVPVGLNIIRYEDEKDMIDDCNEQFLRLFDFPFSDPSLARGFDMRQLYASSAEHARFRSELETAAKQGRPLVGYPLKVVTRNNEKKTVEISSQSLVDTSGKIVGSTGALRDITQEAELRNRLNELTYDIGSVLHNYTTTLLMVQLSSEPLLRALAPDPFPIDKEVTPEQASEAVARPATRLAEALGQLLFLAKEEGRALALFEEQWVRLSELLAVIRGYTEEIPDIDVRPVVLCEAALETIEFCRLLRPSHKFSRESVTAVRSAAQDLLRVTNLISLHQMRDAALEMDHQVRSLREFVTTNAREPEWKEVCEVGKLIKQVCSNLDDYARSRRVEFKIDLQEAKIKVVRREVLRALTNLLHNAIKYSWSRDKSKFPWVTIRTMVVNDEVHIEFKNWGVPIKKEEIEQELIFKLGYRGTHSGDRGRIGTGIGLADVRRVARAHRGDVYVMSQPAIGKRADEDYTNPFITTVTMKLPLYHG